MRELFAVQRPEIWDQCERLTSVTLIVALIPDPLASPVWCNGKIPPMVYPRLMDLGSVVITAVVYRSTSGKSN